MRQSIMTRMMTRFVMVVAALTGVFSPAVSLADVSLPAIFGDHMVLQYGAPLPIWGWADAGEEVTVKLGDDITATTTAGEDGRWRVTLDAIPLGPATTLTVSGKNSVEFKNVIAGEVWICSGQSNMQWSVQQSADPATEIAGSNFPMIRMFSAQRVTANEPQEDLKGQWQVASPQTVAGFSAVGYYFARDLQHQLARPIGMIHTSWGGTLAEAWTRLGALEADPMFKPIVERRQADPGDHPNRAAVLYNAMLKPLMPYRIKGAIWYQGESNVGRAWQYQYLFPAMIRNWRQDWGQGDFPFYYVQLAPYRYGNRDPKMCAELWEAQLKTLDLPATGMAVTMDIGNVKDIHPKNKQEVGRRLALWALAKTYGRSDLVYSGPLYEYASIEGDSIRVHFREPTIGGGLATSDGEAPSDFQVAGADMKFVDATAKINSSGEPSVVVSSSEVPHPVAVRYAWRDDAQPNLINAQGLPASPFRSDDWTLTTEGLK